MIKEKIIIRIFVFLKIKFVLNKRSQTYVFYELSTRDGELVITVMFLQWVP